VSLDFAPVTEVSVEESRFGLLYEGLFVVDQKPKVVRVVRSVDETPTDVSNIGGRSDAA